MDLFLRFFPIFFNRATTARRTESKQQNEANTISIGIYRSRAKQNFPRN